MTKKPMGALILVATPIGNLEDLSPRAERALRECDLVVAEDTRITRRLLSRLGFRKPMISCFDANEKERAELIVAHCENGRVLALVTSRGHPVISDPGYRVVVRAIEAGVPVSVVPGPCAAISALAVSGLPGSEFLFHGFLPRKGSSRKVSLQKISRGGTHILYESPRRIIETLKDLGEACGNPMVSCSRELSKRFEETLRGTCDEVLGQFADTTPRGEFTLVVHVEETGAGAFDPEIAARAKEIKRRLRMSNKDAALAVSILCRIPKKTVYEAFIGEEDE